MPRPARCVSRRHEMQIEDALGRYVIQLQADNPDLEFLMPESLLDRLQGA